MIKVIINKLIKKFKIKTWNGEAVIINEKEFDKTEMNRFQSNSDGFLLTHRNTNRKNIQLDRRKNKRGSSN